MRSESDLPKVLVSNVFRFQMVGFQIPTVYSNHLNTPVNQIHSVGVRYSIGGIFKNIGDQVTKMHLIKKSELDILV